MTKPVTIEMPEEMYDIISGHAAEAEMSVEAYLLEVIQQYIEDVADMEAAEEELELLEKDE
jgi:predicted DNA-binding protein